MTHEVDDEDEVDESEENVLVEVLVEVLVVDDLEEVLDVVGI